MTAKTVFTPPTAVIHLGDHKYAMVDRDDFERLIKYHWRAVRTQRSWYARSDIRINGRTKHLYMHRMVADTLPDFICHHRNRNSLDNRRVNLMNMTQKDHQTLHLNDTLLIQREQQNPLDKNQ